MKPGCHTVVLFERLGPYHHARLHAVGKRFPVTAIETVGRDQTYAWDQVAGAVGFSRSTLFAEVEETGAAELRKRLWRSLDEVGPRVVALAGWASRESAAALRWCLINRVPAVLMSESAVEDAPRRTGSEAVKSRFVRLCSSGLVGGDRHVAYLAGLGMPTERVFVGYDVVDNDHFASGAEAARGRAADHRQALGLPDRYFLASNRFIQKKNLPNLLRAYDSYRKEAGIGAWGLVLLGDGPLRGEVESLGRELGLERYLLYPGFKQYQELPAYYGLAGAFVQASTSEQWGLVVNEAMASGLPVLVSNRCGCAPDLVEEGRNGFTFDPHDVEGLAGLLGRIASDDCDREAMGRASREVIARWTPETFGENLEKAVQAALAAPRPRANVFDRALLWALARR